MRKSIILIISFTIFLVTCSKEQPTNLSSNYDKYQIQNDSDWVEITDTMNINVLCLDPSLIYTGKVIMNDNDYRDLWNKSSGFIEMWKNLRHPDSLYAKCKEYTDLNIDFQRYSLLGFAIITGIAETNRYVYVNHKRKEYLHLLHIIDTSNYKRGDAYYKWVAVPKIPGDYLVKFDTILTYIN